MFSLFGSKRELFPGIALPNTDVLTAMGHAYAQLLESNRDYLMLQHQAYACEWVREELDEPRADAQSSP